MQKAGIFAAFVCLWVVFGYGVVLKAEPTAADQAQAILDAAGVKGGLVVQIGCGDGTLSAALCANDSYIVHSLDPDTNNVALARANIRLADLYGRVSVDHWAKATLPYADNLVNLVVSENLGAITTGEVMRVLCPEGVAYIKVGETWVKTVKPRPDNIDEWTHFLHDASNNAVADDEVAGVPRRMQWAANPLWLRSHETPSGISSVVTSGGRIFYLFDQGVVGINGPMMPDTWSLIARDAFNGIKLWEKPLENWGWTDWDWDTYKDTDWTEVYPKRTSSPPSVTRRLVAAGDRVFVTLGYWAPVSILDAATGQVLHTVEETLGADEILHSSGIVLASIKNTDSETAKRRGETVTDSLVAFDADTGVVSWQTPVPSLNDVTLAIEEARVFYASSAGVTCIDLNTGVELWNDSSDTTTVLTLVVNDGRVLVSDSSKLRCYAADNGELLWTYVKGADKSEPKLDMFVVNGLVWRGILGTGLDPNTGSEMVQLSTTNLRSGPHHHRCYRSKATPNFILSAKEGIELLDLHGSGETNDNSRNNWLRGACKYGVMPANGMIYVPPDQCFCEPGVKVLGFTAVITDANEPEVVEPDRLETGPAYGQSITPNPAAHDWPTYRHDGSRSGSTVASVAPGVDMLWSAQIAGKLSAPVVAEGKLFVAAVDEHTVHAINAADGNPIWNYTAGGRVDSPPTIYQGLAIFGCTDGWVYCLRASDGELLWRFRAAPKERRIGSFGQVESAWPVHGSVLIQNGLVYFSAGRSSFLDGGVRVFGLDPFAGNVIYESTVEGPYEDLAEGSGQTFWLDGTRNDILVGDGSSIYLGQRQLDNSLAVQNCEFLTTLGDRDMGLHIFSTAGFLDDTWYNRAFWAYWARWPGFYLANQAPKSGQILVFDDQRTYAVKAYTRRNRHSPMYFPETDGYLLYADENTSEPGLVDVNGVPVPLEWLPQSGYWLSNTNWRELTDLAVGKDKHNGFTRPFPAVWQEWLPIRVRAMVKAGDTIFVAGVPDLCDPNDHMASFEGRNGALLRSVSAIEGQTMAEYQLGSMPVWDGMIAVDGRIYVALDDGSIKCYAGTNYAPAIDGGGDRNVYPMAPAVLDAAVTDDGLPRVDPGDPCSLPIGITAGWSKIAGPGSVVFGDANSVDTTASFSQWGEYTLRLDAFDGGVSYYDDLNIKVLRPGDLDGDDDVDDFDLERFAGEWMFGDCQNLNEWCAGADQAASGTVGNDGFAVMAFNWLLGVEPDEPTGLSVTGNIGDVSLDWDDNTEEDLAGYNVYRSLTSGSGYTKLNSSPLTSPDYVDTDISSFLTWYYVVTAVDTYGWESAWSMELSAIPGPKPGVKLVAALGVTTDVNDLVTEWLDQANDNDATQDTWADRPLYVPSAINGEAAIAFDGSGVHLDVADSSDINKSGPHWAKTLTVVFKTSADVATKQIIWEQGGNNKAGLTFYIDGGTLYINGWALNTTDAYPDWGQAAQDVNITVNPDTVYVASLVMDSTAEELKGYVNGSLIGTYAPAYELPTHGNNCAFGHNEDKSKFISGSNGDTADFAGLIAEFYEFNAVLSETNRQALENIMITKYAISGGP